MRGTLCRDDMSEIEDRLKDILLMTIAIQLSIVGTQSPDGSLQPLLFIGLFITILVALEEAGRRLLEYSNR